MKKKFFALYIHWPYCLRRCPYCDFNAHVAADSGRNQVMANGLLRQLQSYRRHEKLGGYFAGKKISSVFFGGGTPSLMPPHLVEELLTTAKNLYGFTDDIEITLEANPGTLEGASILKDFKSAGVNRLSMGVQSLYDDALQRLGRIHNAAEAIKIIETLPSIFDRWSFDLIYSRPGQTMAAWLGELELALSFAPSHLSLYQLTIEPGTDFFRQAKEKKLIMPPDDLSAEMFVTTRDVMAANGLPSYEISNFARVNQASRHNLTYWHYGDWLAVGPGGEGRLTLPQPDEQNNGGNNTHQQKFATKNFRLPDKWATQVVTDNIGIESFTAIEPADAVVEKIMMGLRLTDGISLPSDPPETLPENFDQKWQDLVDDNLAVPAANHHYRLTEGGLLRLNSVINYLT
ncbi:MAG: radical SAM family heme chaperone HemW [Hydrotalea sp.]|nr:radical SAM family heme chaperone HemW [Hydrotalea sp.]